MQDSTKTTDVKL